MKKQTCFPVVLIAALFAGERAHAFARAQPVSQIQAESAVPKAQIEQLRRDFDWLGSVKTEATTDEFREVLEIPDATPASLSGWLNARVHYLLAEDFKPSLLNIRPYFFKNFQYPVNESPDIELPEEQTPAPAPAPADPSKAPQEAPQGEEKPKPQGKVVMSNLGAGLYYLGKTNNVLLGLKVRGVGKVPLTSPRAGIIMVGEGLFYDGFYGEGISKESPIRKAFRMSTFFHEARHSDGNGKALGFMHALCPKGHNYEGLNACDRNINGPYTVGALIDEHLSKSCADCSEAERETIRLFGLESRSRIIPAKDGSAPTRWSAAPEGEFSARK